MSNTNVAVLSGNLTRDPESRTTSTGKTVTSFAIAVNGFRDDETLFINCEVWGKAGDIAAQFLRKGSNVTVNGRLKPNNWEDREGNKRRDIVLSVSDLQLPPKSRDGAAPARDGAAQQRDSRGDLLGDPTPQEDDDLPF